MEHGAYNIEIDLDNSRAAERFCFVYDPHKTFVTVADADTLFHRSYFQALSILALSLSPEQRRWRCFQAPLFLVRNLEVVPAILRAGIWVTCAFELGQLGCSSWASCFLFSSYSLPLLLCCNEVKVC